ncbi:T9SS type A sorting domain-containing protein [Epilithonimonas sp. JDS]|uniref:GEVED domain-containing protein n=1 Tax=Epilithonimonas sp. JDS TaxID=2902797 RepID=UPI001E52D7D9|nr:GEVED domain-containing protein [Epilithonimonas sp. JDS]MCD9855087.1 T9SS type A sorting domain-containing protein [Epilithonimonas sp. JDS]
MKKVYLLLLGITMSSVSAQQMEFRLIDEMGARFYDVNDSGNAIHSGAYYNYTTNTTTSTEGGQATNRINNAGDVAGATSVAISEEESIAYAAYRKGGTWSTIGYFEGETPSSSSFANANDISQNGKYVTGQIGATGFTSWPFLYDTETNTLTKLSGEGNYVNGRGEAVNSSGIVAGFADREDLVTTGTFWMPAYFEANGTIHYIDMANLESGEAADINNAGQIVGYKGGKPFIYDITTGIYKSFNPPSGFEKAVFTSVSENGIALGYAGDAGNREVIIYHPSLGSGPIFLKDVLARNGVNITTFDTKLGTGMNISPNGNFVCGFDNTIPPFFAGGWIVNLNNLLLGTNDCRITCPENIETTIANVTQTSAAVNYTLPIVCGSSSSTGLTTVLVSGFESGAQFPIGKTDVVHNLIDADGKVVYVCSFQVTVNDLYCSSAPQWGTDAISKVQFAGIDNSSDPYAVTPNEYYLDKVGEVYRGSEYPFVLEANTNSGYDYATVFVDWNQNGSFTDAGEVYEVGAMTSDGADGAQITGDISVPSTALIGKTRMRVVLNWDVSMTNPCDNTDAFFGQSEDYMLDVKESLAASDINKANVSIYPNPVKNVLNFNGAKDISKVEVYNVAGQKVKSVEKLSDNKIELSNLTKGTYIIRANIDGLIKSFKFIKE